MDPSWKKKADKETKEYQIIMVFLMIAFGCSGSPGLFFFIIAGLSLYRSDLIKAAWNRILPGEKIRFKPAIIIGFVLIGILCFLVQYDHYIESRNPPPSSNQNDYYSLHSATPSPSPRPNPTPQPTHSPMPTPSPTPYQPRDDDIGITYEEFMQGFEEYKRNGGSGYSSDTWGEDNTTNEVTGDLGMIVYWTPGGKSYHFSITCPSLSRSKEIYYSTLQEAINAGKTDPCNNCAY